MSQLEKLVSLIAGRERLPYQSVDRWAAKGQIQTLYQLADNLQTHIQNPQETQIGRYRSMYNRIFAALALEPGTVQVRALLDLLTRYPQPEPITRWIAAMIASAQPARIVNAVMDEYATHPLLQSLIAYIIHEYVIHGVDIIPHFCMAEFAGHLVVNEHPLGKLPLTLFPNEAPIHQHMLKFSLGRVSHDVPVATLMQTVRAIPPTPSGYELTKRASNSTQIGAAFAAWISNSHGRVDVGTYSSKQPITQETILNTGLLHELPLKSNLHSRATGISVMPITAQSAFCALFEAASHGGAHDNGIYHAQGRLEAWTSVAGLVGASTTTAIEDVHNLMDACQWYRLSTNSVWFEHLGWDVFLLAVRPDGLSLAMVAATDAS